MKAPRYCFILAFCTLFAISHAQVIYNAYAKATAISGTLITVSNVNQASHSFNVGEIVVVMQMQDDVIGTNTTNVVSFGNLNAIGNAGNYELAQISAVNVSMGTPTSIAVSAPLLNTYNTGANSSVQLITLRLLSPTVFTSTNNITGLAWDGNVGGVIALQVGTIFTLGHTISANQIGFTGGPKNTPNFASTSCDNTYVTAIGNKWAGKGEGIYKNTNASLAGGRGKILTGGGSGNDENSGGGGGGNYTAGGMGGPGYTGGVNGCVPSVGGLGGIALSAYISASRVFMGGGGGGGHENNNVGTPGGAGGGIILLKTGTLVTTGACGSISITANGASVTPAGNDGSGGGGAAGSIVMQVNSYSISNSCSLAITANGGNGGNSNYVVAHGGGGGGSQGVVIFSGSQPTANVTASTIPGNGGESCTGCTGTVNGVPGDGPPNAGIITNSVGPLPVQMMYFDARSLDSDVALSWATASEKNTDYFILEKSGDEKKWDFVSKQKAAENSMHPIYYEDKDAAPVNGISYYRLTIVYRDKSQLISPSRMVDRSNKNPYVIFYPNPASDVIHIVSSGNAGNIEYGIYDISGKKVNVDATTVSENKITIDLSSVSKGVYLLTIKSPGTDAPDVNKIIIR